jgi:Cu-Zn family superoxide dismutase
LHFLASRHCAGRIANQWRKQMHSNRGVAVAAAGMILAMGLVAVSNAAEIKLALHGAMASSSPARAGAIRVTLHRLTPEGPGREIGTVEFRDVPHGLLIAPDLHELTPGPHAAHIHEKPDCGPAKRDGELVLGGAAGGHFDPKNTGRHEGPYGEGHLGDLPVLIAEADGGAKVPMLAPRLKAADIAHRTLMIHAGADRYDQHAAHAHGKGGMRMYCGVIP